MWHHHHICPTSCHTQPQWHPGPPQVASGSGSGQFCVQQMAVFCFMKEEAEAEEADTKSLGAPGEWRVAGQCHCLSWELCGCICRWILCHMHCPFFLDALGPLRSCIFLHPIQTSWFKPSTKEAGKCIPLAKGLKFGM